MMPAAVCDEFFRTDGLESIRVCAVFSEKIEAYRSQTNIVEADERRNVEAVVRREETDVELLNNEVRRWIKYFWPFHSLFSETVTERFPLCRYSRMR